MYIYTIQCTHYIYDSSQPCLTLLTSCILITCNNYITTRINLVTNQQLLCNKCMTLNNTYNHATCIHFHHLIYDVSTRLQLVCNYISTQNLKFRNLKFGWETLKQVTHGSISTNLPKCINDLHVFMFIVKKFMMNFFFKFFYSSILCISYSFGDVIFISSVLIKIIFVCLI
jgi:hypothetical protein